MNAFLHILKSGSDTLRSRMIGHLAGIVLGALVAVVVIVFVRSQREVQTGSDQEVQAYISLRGVDFGNPVDRALFRESLEVFYPGRSARNDSLMITIDDLRQRSFDNPEFRLNAQTVGLHWATLGKLGVMYLQFFLVYAIVLGVIYLMVQRIAIYRFVKMKQHRESYLLEALRSVRKLKAVRNFQGAWRGLAAVVLATSKAAAKGSLLIVLFTPAYVIAYSVKTTLDTSSLLFMGLLAVVSNGVLIHTSNRFFTVLVAESRKGYVQTAVVKNLSTSYEWNAPDGIPLRSLWRVGEGFQGHVFRHIFLNARFQFIPALKEHASFLITGLIIIEMALNIQGHLSYELLRQILYRQYDAACVVVFGIFLVVKATEMSVDIWHDWEKRRYGY